MKPNVLKLLGLLASLGLFVCGGETQQSVVPQCSSKPSDGVYATFRVANEYFYASITDPTGINQAIALWRGRSNARIPNGSLVCQPVDWNCGWSWHLDPASVRFAEIAAEVCDGRPSYVERNCSGFGGGRFCPWSALLVELRDCRSDPSCPVMAR